MKPNNGFKYIIIILIILCTILIVSCSTPAVSKIIETTQVTSTTLDPEKQLKINDYNTKLNEFGTYINAKNDAVLQIDKEMNDLDKKRLEAGKAKDMQKAVAYMQIEKDKCEEIIKNLAKIFVPEITKEYNSYVVDHYIGLKQWMSYAINSYSDPSNFDSSKAESLMDNANNAETKSNQEFQRIVKNLNNEAGELGLPIPFPNQ